MQGAGEPRGLSARAFTPGTFVAPPPRAEEMYAPETFGRGEAAWVRVRVR